MSNQYKTLMHRKSLKKKKLYDAPSTAKAHGELSFRTETLAQPYLVRDKGRRNSDSAKLGTEDNP